MLGRICSMAREDVHQVRKHDDTVESWREMKWQASEQPRGQGEDL